MYTWLSRARGFTLIELLVVIAIVAIVLATVIGGCGAAMGGCSQSSGFRVGKIQKASDSGIVFTTHELEVVTEGLAKSPTGGMTSIWYATVYDASIWKQIQDLPTDKAHKFHYKHRMWVMPWNGATKYEITKVDPAGSG